jgi:hypothetical protein
MTLRNRAHNPNAFPGSVYDDAAEGMELRDYFAAQVIGGMLADPDGCPHPVTGAAVAYTWADAMLAARLKRSAPQT